MAGWMLSLSPCSLSLALSASHPQRPAHVLPFINNFPNQQRPLAKSFASPFKPPRHHQFTIQSSTPTRLHSLAKHQETVSEGKARHYSIAQLPFMGNAACAPYAASGGSAKVIGSDGEFDEYAGPVRAAELMVENPGQFVCDAGHLSVGYRVPGLAADEELERRRLYFLLPMDMLFSVLTEEEMAALACRAAAAIKKGPGASKSAIGRRIFPVLSEFCLLPPEGKRVSQPSRSVKRPMSRQRSWKPALDTIEEVS